MKNKTREFFKQLVSTITNQENKNTLLNSLIVLLKLRYEDFFILIWPIYKEKFSSNNNINNNEQQQQQPKRVLKSRTSSLHTKSARIRTSSFDSFALFDMVLLELCTDESSPNISENKFDKNQLYLNRFLLVSNAINFLHEAIKCEQVKKLLEK